MKNTLQKNLFYISVFVAVSDNHKSSGAIRLQLLHGPQDYELKRFQFGVNENCSLAQLIVSLKSKLVSAEVGFRLPPPGIGVD